MKKCIHIAIACSLVTGSLLSVSCNKNVFNDEDYEKILDYESPIDSIDATHNWKLFTTHNYSVTANAGYNAKKVIVYSAYPLGSSDAEIMAQKEIGDGQTKTISVVTPLDATVLYAALEDADGKYTITRFAASASSIDFSSPMSVRQTMTTQPRLQQHTYCFEEEMPVPGDYDYNDIVLRVSQETVDSRRIQLHVELCAVGGKKQLAAGIRLVGYQYEQLDSVTTEGNQLFTLGGSNYNQEAPTGVFAIWGSQDLLQRGNHDEAAIFLFDDAHWAMGDNITIENSSFTRKYYNVAKNSSASYELLPTRVITYNLYFKEGVNIENFSLASLDVFMIESYNGSNWEVHSYEHRSAQVKFEYTLANTKAQFMPWALVVPYSGFRYPLEGQNIGFRKQGTSFGCYSDAGHSFGEWAQHADRFHDWYFYPTQNQVY